MPEFHHLSRLDESHIVELHEMYLRQWWSPQRTLEEVRKMLEHSSEIFAFADQDNRLVAFTRVMTDYVYHGIVMDVMVAERHRGAGLGRMLVDAIVEHPQLRQLEMLSLWCRPDMIPFYEQWGFTADIGELHLMRRLRLST